MGLFYSAFINFIQRSPVFSQGRDYPEQVMKSLVPDRVRRIRPRSPDCLVADRHQGK